MNIDWKKIGVIAGLVGLVAWLADNSSDEKECTTTEPTADVKGLGGLKKKKKKSKK